MKMLMKTQNYYKYVKNYKRNEKQAKITVNTWYTWSPRCKVCYNPYSHHSILHTD